jgi:AraC-like DNA-binding protein
MASRLGLDTCTFQHLCDEQLLTSPKSWAIHERMMGALPLLVEGCSNKEIAAQLHFEHESNFCRSFKHHFGCSPQEFLHRQASDLALSRFDNSQELPRVGALPTLHVAQKHSAHIA